ncbi:MAG TPA: hypothetical protein EYQ54_18860, partial [Myxococcales bacterium]|nr:hypothetical protein [Myxococcales bacterium]
PTPNPTPTPSPTPTPTPTALPLPPYPCPYSPEPPWLPRRNPSSYPPRSTTTCSITAPGPTPSPRN